ncbi:MAG: ribonucleoside-triphosphate reductase, adenosylcobalamin-dependent [Euryarchaeota archaeon]|nr:ribonucleoside-triphosphate reductase, adenosylcobalamin-dependent [Euryarchaeota archaeon]
MKYATKLSDEFVNSYRTKTPPWGPLGYVTYKRTYARMTNTGQTEEWWQTVARCCQGILDIGGVFTKQEIEQLYDMVFNLKCCFSGRALWQLGTSTVQRVGADSLQNCWHVAVNNPHAFCFTFNELMLGGGVGFTITPEQVYELPTVKYGVAIERCDKNDVDFIVPDNREGWVDLLSRILDSFFVSGKNLTYSTVCIRSKGKPIRSFGGTASGSENLVEGISQIVGILQGRVNHKLRPIDCLDIMNIIGSIVVAGNVRRAAELAAGSPDDLLFLTAKSWNKITIPNWRSMSNNSVICSDIKELRPEFWDNYNGTGEPYGLINLELCRTHGRLIDGYDYRPDYMVTGTNPCGEIPLESYEACNLFELFLPNLTSLDEYITAAVLGYKVCKTISKYPFSDPMINAVVEKNHRLGVSITGVLQSRWVSEPESMDKVYQAMEEADTAYSRNLGVSTSIKLTTIKPSGTLSLLPGVTSGIHPAYAGHYIRRVRFASNDPIIKICRDAKYPVEPLLNADGTRNLDTMIVSFPVKSPSGTILANKVTAIDQLKFQGLVQDRWSDNSVSTTCYYTPKELPAIRKYLEEYYTDSIKTVSFLLHKEHGFSQAPFEEISAEQYRELAKSVKPIISVIDTDERVLEENFECASGTCPIR